MYSFNYAYFKKDKELIKDEKERFFSGIKIRNLDFEDQATTTQNINERQGQYLGVIFQFAALAAVVLATVLWFLGKYNYVKWIVRILSLSFLTLGCVFAFFYSMNLFFGDAVESMLYSALICLDIGFVLHKIKIPNVK